MTHEQHRRTRIRLAAQRSLDDLINEVSAVPYVSLSSKDWKDLTLAILESVEDTPLMDSEWERISKTTAQFLLEEWGG